MASGDVESGPILSGSIAESQDRNTAIKMLQLPMGVSLSSPVAREWLLTRKNNIRPWLQFLQTSRFQNPTSLPRLTARVVKNIDYFQSNYLFVFIGLVVYCLITSPLLLLAVCASLGVCHILSKRQAEKKLTILGHELSVAQQYGLVAACSLPVFYIVGAGSVVFWVLGASMFLILLHATFYNIEGLLGPEESFEMPVQQV